VIERDNNQGAAAVFKRIYLVNLDEVGADGYLVKRQNRELGVLDDNNDPFSSARVPGQPDPNEFIVIRLDRPLRAPAAR
jgi:hypothetical protein